MVYVSTSNMAGTGFFVDDDGTLVTAAHVLFEMKYTAENGKPSVKIGFRGNLHVRLSDGTSYPVESASIEDDNRQSAAADLALVRNSVPVPTTCHIPLSKNSVLVGAGDHVIAIGYPAASPVSQVLYEGFVSSIYVPIFGRASLDANTEVFWKQPLLQAQMPITPGMSGAPLINDSGEAVGVMEEEQLPFNPQLAGMMDQYNPNAPILRPDSQPPIADDLPQAPVVALGWTLRNFVAPGSGSAVPVSYFDPRLSAQMMEVRTQPSPVATPTLISPPQ